MVVEEPTELVVDEEEVDELDVGVELEVDDAIEVLVEVELVEAVVDVVVDVVPTFSHQLTSLMAKAAPTMSTSPSPSTSAAWTERAPSNSARRL